MKKLITMFAFMVLAILSVSCGADLGEFEEKPEQDFILFDMFKDPPLERMAALDEIWTVMDQHEMNVRLSKLVNDKGSESQADFVTFSYISKDLLSGTHTLTDGSHISNGQAVLPVMLKDVKIMLHLILSVDETFRKDPAMASFYSKDSVDYQNVMFALADRLRRSSTEPGMTESILAIARHVTNYLNTKTADKLQADMADLIDNINDLERSDFLLLTKNLGKMMAAASTTMLLEKDTVNSSGTFGILVSDINDTTPGTIDSGLGNAVKGNYSLLSGLRDRVGEKISDRGLVYDLVSDLRSTLLNKDNSPFVKDLVYNLENYFTVGGSVYSLDATDTTTTSNTADPTTANFETVNPYNLNSTNIYSDTELGNTLKETLADSVGLLLRDDRCGALTPSDGSKSYILDRFAQRLHDTGIDWKNAKLEESLFDITIVDPYGRDRRVKTGSTYGGKTNPYAISFIEDFFFLGLITNNFGWKDGGSTNEVAGSSSYQLIYNEHGHGAPTNYITLNDSLDSITSQKDQNTEFLKYLEDLTGGSVGAMGTYELALALNSRVDHIYRSKNPFTFAGRDPYKFFYNQNYPALAFATGAAVGDLGLPGGGNTAGNTGETLNSYRAYNGNGISDMELAGWTLAWVSRSCFEGEGPYYYKDPNAAAVTLNGKTYHKYMRPNGKIYAYVHYNGETPDEYIYAADNGDPIDSSLATIGSVKQRDNRYKSTWNSEYYMIVNKKEDKCYTPAKMDGTDDKAGCLTFNELIGEYETIRGCASQEEAIFRNYQWVMTEKKMVLIIPMWIYMNVSDLNVAIIQTAVYQIIEGHGFSGTAPCRKYRANGVWAKANTSGTSKIPGDYRMTVLAEPITYHAYLFGIGSPIALLKVDAAKIYEDTLGFGPATYSTVYHALAPLYRLGFPRSPLYTEDDYATGYGDHGVMNFEHTQLGSRQFEAKDTDYNWSRRNMIMPLLGALVNAAHESATPNSKTISNFLDGLMPLFKPLFFFNRNNFGGVCMNSFLPRIAGDRVDDTDVDYNFPHSKSLIPEQFITGFENYSKDAGTGNGPDSYFGGWSVRDYYMAKPMTTLFSTLIDQKPIDMSKPDSNIEFRGKGILPLLTQYDITKERSESNQSPTRVVSNIVDQLAKLGDSKYDDKSGINYSADDFDDSQFTNWGARRKILYGIEQIMSAGKVSKGTYTRILQELSNTASATKTQRIPEWIFSQRDVDLDLNEILDRVVGYNDPDGTGPLKGKGLANYPDDKPAYGDWTDFDNDLEDIDTLVDNLLIQGTQYTITDNLLDVIDLLLGKNITDDEIASIMFTTGKLLAKYDTQDTENKKWIWQGEQSADTQNTPNTDFAFVWRMLKDYLPEVHKTVSMYNNTTDGTAVLDTSVAGTNYKLLVKELSAVLEEDGLAPFIMDVTLSSDMKDILEALSFFLDRNFLKSGGSMWSTLSDLLDQLAGNVDNTTPSSISDIYSGFGLEQTNF